MGSNQETWWKDWDYLPWSWLVPWLLREAMRHEVQKSGVWGWFFFLNLLFCTGVQPIHYTEAEVEASVFWSPDTDSWPIGKVPDAGKDWGQKEKKASEDELAGQHHWFNEHELDQTPGDGRPGLLLFMGLQRVWHNWATEHQQQSRSCDRLYFLGLQNHCRQWLQPWN